MPIDFQQRIINFVKQVVIPAEQKLNPGFSEKSIDGHYYTGEDAYWEEAEVSPNGRLDYQEGLNFSLFKYDKKSKTDAYAEKFESFAGIDVPWHLSAQEMKDPNVAKKVYAIDHAISALDAIIRRDTPSGQSPNPAEYERKMAIGLFAFIMHDPKKKGMIEADISKILNNEGLNGFARAISGVAEEDMSCNKYPCGMARNTMEITMSIENNVGDLLKAEKMRGKCTDLSYLYAFATRRAGLNAGFAVANPAFDDEAIHFYNVVYLTDGTTLSVDMGLGKIAGEYAKSRKIDYYQALSGYYRQKAQFAIVRGDSPEAIEQHFQMALSLNPTDALNHAYYAAFLDDHSRTDEAYKHFELSFKYGGGELVGARFNLATMLANHGRAEEAKPHFQYIYDKLKSRVDKFNEIMAMVLIGQVSVYYVYAEAARNLGKLDEALIFFRKAIEAKPDRYNTFSKYADVLMAKGDDSSLKEAKDIFEKLMGMDGASQKILLQATNSYLLVVIKMWQKGLATEPEMDNAYKLVIAKQPNNIVFLANYMVYLNNTNRREESALVAKKFTEFPDSSKYPELTVQALEIQGGLLLDSGQIVDASTIYEKAIKLAPNDPIVQHDYALCLQRLATLEIDQVKKEKLINMSKEYQDKACQLNSNLPLCLKHTSP